jgi:Fur family ferric uptake transcriptional regulator
MEAWNTLLARGEVNPAKKDSMSTPSSKRSVKTLPCGRPAMEHGPAPATAKLEEWHQQLRDYLLAQGLKNSEQRWKIAESILSTGGHLDAQGIVDRVKTKHPDIGAATVYRNLKVLCDANILKESLTDPQGRVIYELFEDEHHDHIICVDCGEIFEFHNDKIESLQTSVVKNMSFTEVRHRHVVYAKCTFKGH